MADTSAAHYQFRTYFFQLLNKSKTEFSITMYNTHYTFILAPNVENPGEETPWKNHASNKMDMVPGLIAAVVEVVYSTVQQ